MFRPWLIATLAVGSLPLGPPRVEVVHDGLPAGILARIETHVHVDLDDAEVRARVVTGTSGKLHARPLALHTVKAGHHYELRRPGVAGAAHLVVVTVEQGPGGEHGAAEAIVAVDASGRIRHVSYPSGRWFDMPKAPRRATEGELAEALAGVNAE